MPNSGASAAAGFEIAITGGAVIHTPADIRLMTPYILLEQEDWFEEETGFLRNLIEPGSTVIDVGANYGVYAASLAVAAGPRGRVVAVEPASMTTGFLERTLKPHANAHVVRAALGDEAGEASLVIADNSETNRLTDSAETGEAVETVPLLRLDDMAAEWGVSDPDFIKLDAEGAETRILAGASVLLRESDPLVMFERKHGTRINTDLIQAFEELSFEIFQLLPGPGVLVPHDPKRIDAFGLNLFAAREGRISVLEETGRLIRAWPGAGTDGDPVSGLLARANRFAEAAEAAGQTGAAVSPLLDFARTSRMLGLRSPAVEALSRALAIIDRTPVEDSDSTRMKAAVVTANEKARNYSSYFADQSTLPMLDWLSGTPYLTPEMERRRQLMQIRAGLRQRLEWSPVFDPVETKNPAFWRGEVKLVP